MFAAGAAYWAAMAGRRSRRLLSRCGRGFTPARSRVRERAIESAPFRTAFSVCGLSAEQWAGARASVVFPSWGLQFRELPRHPNRWQLASERPLLR